MTLKVGCDPEFFLKRNGVNVSAHGLVPGTKAKPHKLKNGAIQLDGTAVEFNIDPASSAEEFAGNIESVLKQVREMIPKEYEFDFSPAVIYDPKYFDENIPYDCKELGCDPDFNAITGAPNPRPAPAGKLRTLRTGSGHIHIGWNDKKMVEDVTSKNHMWDCMQVVRLLDTYFSHVKTSWDKDTVRANLYGAHGAFRPKPYGVEYRVLSNAWLKHPNLWPWLFNSVSFLMEKMKEGESADLSYNPNDGQYTWVYMFKSHYSYLHNPRIKDKGRFIADVLHVFGAPPMPAIKL
jgi:hypothetical protein